MVLEAHQACHLRRDAAALQRAIEVGPNGHVANRRLLDDFFPDDANAVRGPTLLLDLEVKLLAPRRAHAPR
eukprot:11214733-Lingulodinium_polyedra.AAC.1